MSEDRDVLDPAARALLDEVEPPNCPLPDGLRAQMRGRMDLALAAAASPAPTQTPPTSTPPAAPSAPAPAPAPSGGVPWRFVAPGVSAIMGATVATLVLSAVSTPQIVYVDRPVPTTTADAAPPAASAPAVPSAKPTAPLAPLAPQTPSPPSAVAPPRAPAPASTEADDPLVAETRLIDTARAAFARRDFDASLAAVRLHETQFPSGRLAEEREALAVQALVGAHKDAEARARGERFHQRFPASLLQGAVDSALSSIP